MKSKMEKQFLVPLSLCDNTARLSVPGLFITYMDMASEHGTEIGLGAAELSKKNLFWLAVKTKVKIIRRPDMLESVNCITWPEKPVRVRCNRYYVLKSDDEVIAEGKTEWAMINTETGRLCRYDEIYPENLEHYEEKVCEQPFARISEDFSSDEELGVYTVRSTDIDLGQHLNNAAYVRIIFGMLSCAELETLDIKEMEINFRSPCYEGDILSVRRRKTDNGFEVGVIREDGTTASVAQIVF